MTPHPILDARIGIINGISISGQPNTQLILKTEAKAEMRCTSNCNINCYFHSRMGCTIDKGFKHIPTDRFVKHREEKMVGRYKVRKGSR